MTVLPELNDSALTILQEECAELIVSISKIKRFGQSPKSFANFEQEFADVLCLLDYFLHNKQVDEHRIKDGMDIKRQKLSLFAKDLVWGDHDDET